jgi:hypothetical protein
MKAAFYNLEAPELKGEDAEGDENEGPNDPRPDAASRGVARLRSGCAQVSIRTQRGKFWSRHQ